MIPAQLTVRITNNYGNRAVYPVCDTAQKIAALIGAKTFTDAAQRQLKEIGFTFVVEQQTI